MKRNSLYEGQKINVSKPGEQSPSDEVECHEDCPHCPPSRSWRDCSELECIYDDIDAETAGDIEYHRLVDEGKLDKFGRRKDE